MRSSDPRWLTRFVVERIHERQLQEHGGEAGLRDDSLVESAQARPKNAYVYRDTADLCTLAAEYTFGISRNHPFVDGNKRTAFLAAYVFLELNGLVVSADETAVFAVVTAISAGDIDAEEFGRWLRGHVEEA